MASSSTLNSAALAEEGYDPAWLELEAAMGGRKHLAGNLAEKRVQYNGMAASLQQLWPPIEGVDVENISIPLPASTTSTTKTLPLRIYKPTTPRQDPSAGPPLPTVVWYHGGGWANGTLDSEHAQCLRLASLCPCAAVVAVGYGLLPENGTAGMLDDCLAGFTWARERVVAATRSPLVVLGGSAGGALALGVAYRLGLAGRGDEVAGVVALYPVAVHPSRLPERWEGLHASFGELEGTAPLVRGVDQLGVLELAEKLSPADDPLYAVKFSYDEPALKKFPRTYIATAQKDLMRDDGVVLEAALKDAGVAVKRDHYMGLPHYFWFFAQLGEKTQGFLENVAEGIRWVVREDGEEGGLVVHEV